MRAFFDLIYPSQCRYTVEREDITCTSMHGTCQFCEARVEHGWWHHVLYECTQLGGISGSAQWGAFVRLLSGGYQGLAVYTCFPLLAQHLEQLTGGFTPDDS